MKIMVMAAPYPGFTFPASALTAALLEAGDVVAIPGEEVPSMPSYPMYSGSGLPKPDNKASMRQFLNKKLSKRR